MKFKFYLIGFLIPLFFSHFAFNCQVRTKTLPASLAAIAARNVSKTRTAALLKCVRQGIRNGTVIKINISAEAQLLNQNELIQKINELLKKEGFFGNTKIKIKDGYSYIEELKVGDLVATFDLDSKQIIYKPITYKDKIHVDKHFQIILTDDTIIKVAPDQKFHYKDGDKWITAQEMYSDPQLAKSIDPKIKEIKLVREGLDVVRITVAEQHSFYITEHDILAHNYIPIAFEVTITWGTYEGIVITYAILAPTIALGTIKLINWVKTFFVDNDFPTQTIFVPERQLFPTGFYAEDNQSNKEIKIIPSIQLADSSKKDTKSSDAQAPGKPTEADGFIPPKKWNGEKVKNPNGPGYGWPDKKGNIWIPSGPNGHGGPHWDVQLPNKDYRNVLPGGKIRGTDQFFK